MSTSFEINAEPRSDTGKGASRRLRRAAQVPGVIYGAKKDPAMISVSHNELIRHLENEAFYSHILTVVVDGKKEQVVLKDLYRHPSKPFIQHLDLLRVSDETKIRVRVPLHFVGEDVAPGVKTGGGIVSHNVIDVEVSCFPKDLPEFIDVDISAADIGDTVHLSDLVLPQGAEIPALAQGPEQDLIVAAVIARIEEPSEEEAAAEAEAEGEPQEGEPEGEES